MCNSEPPLLFLDLIQEGIRAQSDIADVYNDFRPHAGLVDMLGGGRINTKIIMGAVENSPNIPVDEK